MLQIIRDIVRKVTGKNGITPDTDFVKDLGLNSLEIMSVISEFEDRFDMTIPVRDVWKMRKVEDVIVYLEKKGIS